MKIIFFAVPYRGHLQPNLPLLRSLLERGHSLTILGGEDFLRRNLADKDLTTRKAKGGGLQFQPLPDYLVRAYQVHGQQVPGQETAAEDFYSYLYKEEKIQRQEILIGSLQDRFFSDYGTWVREEKADWIFYDTYAFYSSKIVEQYAERAMQINSAVWEADKYFQSDSWRAYLEEIVLPELADAWAGDTLQNPGGIQRHGLGDRCQHRGPGRAASPGWQDSSAWLL